MFEEQLGSERRLLDLWLENNFPERETSDTRSLWSFADSNRGDWNPRESSHFSFEAGPSAQDNWQNTTKSFQVLTFLCSEVQLLEQFAQKKFYPTLYVIGGSLVRGHAPPMGDLELTLASLLPTLQDVLDYLEQFEALLHNLLSQTCAILLDDTIDVKRRVVSTALRCASRGLVVLFCLQTLLSIKILPLFFNYRRMLHTMMSKTNQSGAQLALLEEVQDQVVRLEESLRMGAFTSFIDTRIKHGILGKQFQKKAVMTLIESYLLEQTESNCVQLDLPNENVFARSDLLATMLFFVAYCYAVHPKDKRVLKAVLEIHQRSPILPIYYTLVVVPARLLKDLLPNSYISSLPWDYLKLASAQSNAYLQSLQKSIIGRLDRIAFRGAVWATELCSLLSEGEGVISAADREQFLSLLMEGLHMMTHLRQSFDSILQLHVEQLQPMSKDMLRCVTSCICYLKLLSGHIARSWAVIEQNLDFFLEHYKTLLLDQFKRAYDYLLQLERNDRTLRMRRVLSRLGANYQHSPEYLTVCVKLMRMAIQTLQEKASTPQRLLLNFVVHSISGFQFVPDFIETESLACLKQMEVVETMGILLQKMGHCDLLYFHPELMRNAFQQLLQHPEEANKLPHLVNGFLDIRFLAEEAGVGHSNAMFEHDVASMLKVYFLDPLSRVVERDLLSIVCSDVASEQDDSEKHMNCQNNVLPLLQLEPLSLITRDLSVLDTVKVQLSKTLRKLSIRGELHWDTLCKVKNLAQEKYGIVLEVPEAIEGSTPSTLDHLDTSESIRGFIASYMFQLHSFTFVLSPRTPSNPYYHLPEVVGIEDFMDLIQADITQVGQAALTSLYSHSKDQELRQMQPTATLNQRPTVTLTEMAENESAVGLVTPRTRSDEGAEGQGRAEQTTPEDRSAAVSNFLPNHDSFKRPSSIPGIQGSSVLNPGRAPWSFMEKSHHDLYYQESVGSETSLCPAPRSSDGQDRQGRVTLLIRLLTWALVDKLKQVAELCGASETRSVLSQTTQRWQNSQKAVDNEYPVPQAELVRKEVIALLKAGTLTTNIIHKLRFLIGDIGKVVSLVMLVYHGASCVRELTLSMIPRDVLSNFDSLSDFLRQSAEHERLVQEGRPFDYIFNGFETKPSVHVQYMEMLEPVFASALDEGHLEVLRNIFILTPAMSLDHIESMRSLKNQYQGSSLNKVTAKTEDSFAVGLSFLLTMLNQMSKFEAFHWFESASRHYHLSIDRVHATLLSQRNSTVTSTLRRAPDSETLRSMELLNSLKGKISELRLLEHSMHCSKVFFQKRQEKRPSAD